MFCEKATTTTGSDENETASWRLWIGIAMAEDRSLMNLLLISNLGVFAVLRIDLYPRRLYSWAWAYFILSLIYYVAKSSLSEYRLTAIFVFYVLFVYKLAVNAFGFYHQTGFSLCSAKCSMSEFLLSNTRCHPCKITDLKINLFKSLEYLNDLRNVLFE